MRAFALLAATGCITSIHPRGGTLATTAPNISAVSTQGTFSLATELKQRDVVLVFYRGHW